MINQHEYTVVLMGYEEGRWDWTGMAESQAQAVNKAINSVNSLEQFSLISVLDVTRYNKSEKCRKHLEDATAVGKPPHRI